MPIIKGKVHWAKVYKHNQDEGKYKLDLQLLTKEDVDMFKKEKVPVKTDDKGYNRGEYITLWTYAESQEGNPITLKVVDSQLNPVTSLIGNGSVCNVS